MARKRPTGRSASRPKRSSPRAAARRSASRLRPRIGKEAASRTRSRVEQPRRRRRARARRASAQRRRKKARPASGTREARGRQTGTIGRSASRPRQSRRRRRPGQRSTAAKPAPSRADPRQTRWPSRPRHPLSLDRNRRHLPELEDNVPTPPSSLDLDRTPSAARSGRREMREARLQHNETSPELTGGDVDANWEDAYAVGDEAPGGDNPTPDQDRVDDIGKALGVQYEDSEELKAGRQDRRARPPSLGARPGVGRGLSGAR